MSDPEKVLIKTEEVKEEPAPALAPVEAPVKAETAEVVKNVKEMLSSTEGKSVGDLENRVKFLEERLEKLMGVLKDSWICQETERGASRLNLGNFLSNL